MEKLKSACLHLIYFLEFCKCFVHGLNVLADAFSKYCHWLVNKWHKRSTGIVFILLQYKEKKKSIPNISYMYNVTYYNNLSNIFMTTSLQCCKLKQKLAV